MSFQAGDTKYTATALVNITVLDVNNNAPIFSHENYVQSIPEDVPVGKVAKNQIFPIENGFPLPPGSVAGQVEATDADNGINAEIEYVIQKGGYEDFKIDNTTGSVLVSSKLDFDRRNTYNIEIVAVDHGSPSLTGTTTLTVNVINTNDKLPYFIPATQTVEVNFQCQFSYLILMQNFTVF